MLFFIVKCLGYREIYIQGGGRKHFTRHFGSQTVIIWIIQSGSYEANKLEICKNKKIVLWYLSFIVRILLSDIRSWSRFWETVHASRVLMSAKQSIVCWELVHLQTNQTHFCCKFWRHSLDITLSDSGDTCDPKWHLKCPRKFRASPWILRCTSRRRSSKGK